MTRPASLLGMLCVAGCGGELPLLDVALRDGEVRRIDVARLELHLHRDLDVQVFLLPTRGPGPSLEVDLSEAEPFWIGIEGHACAAPPCGPLIAETCSTWLTFAPGLRVNLRLNAPAGNCPPPERG